MRKKLFLAFTLALLLVLVFCATAAADSSGQCGDNVYWAKDENGVVTISGTGPMWDYNPSFSNPSPFDSDQSVTAAVIKSGVTHVGSFLFCKCGYLAIVELPSGLKSIGGWAFYECTSLTSVELPSTLTSIGISTFYGCTVLTSIEFPASLMSIGDHSFDCCKSLTSVELPESLTTIGDAAFANCKSLASVELPSGLKTIGDLAFYNTAIVSIELPSDLTSIGNKAFNDCTALEAVTVISPDAIFGENVFQGASGNLTIYGYTNSTAESYAASNSISFVPLAGQCGDNVYWIKYQNGVVTISGTGPMWDYHWKSKPSPFDLDQTVTATMIESGVTTISSWFFDECCNLTSIELPSSLTSIGDGTFFDCTSLASVGLPSSLTNIGFAAFNGCTSLTSVALPSGLTKIGNRAFKNCTGLEAVTIFSPDAIFGEDVFINTAENLTLYGYPGSTAESYATANSIHFVPLDTPTFFFPASLTTLEDEAFSGTAAGSVVIPKTVTSIAGDPFTGSQVTTIYGYPGSAAETFAAAKGYYFVAITDSWLAAFRG